MRQHKSQIIRLIEETGGFAQVFPEDKYDIVDRLRKADHIVAMTGDGVNDAPALKKADAGVAVSGATDTARVAADVVLLQSSLSVIIHAFEQARMIFGRMKAYSIFRIAETIRVVLFMTLAIAVFNFWLNMDSGELCQQESKQRAQQCLASSSHVIDTLKKSQIQRQVFLREASMRTQPRA